MEVYTIGFTQKSAERFFGLLREARVGRLLDVRLKNTSQLAAFTRRDDLAFFLHELCEADYVHEPLLAPTAEMLQAYRRDGDWDAYEAEFGALMRERRVETLFPDGYFEVRTVLLCSEATADRCHRRLAAEYIAERAKGLEVVHL